jgi:hypothetical protein
MYLKPPGTLAWPTLLSVAGSPVEAANSVVAAKAIN